MSRTSHRSSCSFFRFLFFVAYTHTPHTLSTRESAYVVLRKHRGGATGRDAGYVCVYIYVYMCIYICIYMCIYRANPQFGFMTRAVSFSFREYWGGAAGSDAVAFLPVVARAAMVSFCSFSLHATHTTQAAHTGLGLCCAQETSRRCGRSWCRIYMCVYICIYVYICVCIYVYISGQPPVWLYDSCCLLFAQGILRKSGR